MKFNIIWIAICLFLTSAVILFIASGFEWKSFEFMMALIIMVLIMNIVNEMMIEELDSKLVESHNGLGDSYDALVKDHKKLVGNHNGLANNQNELIDEVDKLESRIIKLEKKKK